MWEIIGIFHGILSVPHNIVMDMNNVMYDNNRKHISTVLHRLPYTVTQSLIKKKLLGG